MKQKKASAIFLGILLASFLCSTFIGGSKTAKGSLQPPSVLQYVPITITNAQNSPTQSPFQQMINVNSAAYSQYEASNLQNIEFFDSSGNIISSWLESGNSASSTTTRFTG